MTQPAGRKYKGSVFGDSSHLWYLYPILIAGLLCSWERGEAASRVARANNDRSRWLNELVQGGHRLRLSPRLESYHLTREEVESVVGPIEHLVGSVVFDIYERPEGGAEQDDRRVGTVEVSEPQGQALKEAYAATYGKPIELGHTFPPEKMVPEWVNTKLEGRFDTVPRGE